MRQDARSAWALGLAVAALLIAPEATCTVNWVADADGALVVSQDAVSWGYALPVPMSASVWAIQHAGGLWVGVGDGGAVVTSPDLVTWTPQTSATTQTLHGLAFGAGTWMAVGAQETIVSSPDAKTWSVVNQAPAGGATLTLNGVAFDGTQWVAVGTEGAILTSPNGGSGTWSQQASTVTVPLSAVASGGGVWVAVGGGGKVLTSANAVVWSAATSGTTLGLNGIAYEAGAFIAVGGSAVPTQRVILRSKDAGATWAAQASAQQGLLSVVHRNALWLATGYTGALATSANGLAWADRPTGTQQSLLGADFDGAQWLAAGGQAMLTSPDAQWWTLRSRATRSSAVAIAHDGRQWVQVGDTGDAPILTSPDGLIWTARASGLAFGGVGGVTPGPGGWVAVAVRGKIISSPDAVLWTPQTSGITTALDAVAANSTAYVAVGYSPPTILTSPDGAVWTSRAVPTLDNLRGVAGNGTAWVAVGDNGRILHSADGVTWTPATSGTTAGMRHVLWDGKRWLALAWDLSMHASLDGNAWTTLPVVPVAGNVFGMATNGDRVVVVGDGAAIASPDAAAWTNGWTGAGTLWAVGARRPVPVSCAPASSAVYVGASATFTAADGMDPFTWSAPGSTNPSATGPSLSTTFPAPGTYTVNVGSSGLPYSSASCTVTVAYLPPPVLACNPASQRVLVGAPATLWTTGGTPAYVWDAPGSGTPGPIPGAWLNVSYAQGGTYTVTATDAGAPGYTPQSAACTVFVDNPPAGGTGGGRPIGHPAATGTAMLAQGPVSASGPAGDSVALVSPKAQPLEADAGPPQSVVAGDVVTLEGAGLPAQGPLLYRWVQLAGPIVSLGHWATATPQFVAPEGPASLAFELTVQDAAGHWATSGVTVDVAPRLAIRATPAGGTAVAFSSTWPTSSMAWDFGDGATSALAAPTHAFAAGTFTVRLTATDAQGRTRTAQLLTAFPSAASPHGPRTQALAEAAHGPSPVAPFAVLAPLAALILLGVLASRRRSGPRSAGG